MFGAIIKKIILFKTFALRTMQYISLVNTILLFLTFKKTYDLKINSLTVLFFSLIFSIVIGYIDYNFIMSIEHKQINEKNDVKHDLIRIEKKLESLLDKKK